MNQFKQAREDEGGLYIQKDTKGTSQRAEQKTERLRKGTGKEAGPPEGITLLI